MAKVSRTVLYGGLLVLAVGSYILTEPQEFEAPERSPRRTAPTNGKSAPAQFTEEDANARFDPLNNPKRNSFKPLVVRTGDGGLGAFRMPNEIPASFAGGVPNWFYTGTAIVDEAPVALLENTVTGEAMFVKPGEAWKQSKVVQITPRSVTLEGPDGSNRTFELMADPVDPEGVYEGMSVEPLDPIGRGRASIPQQPTAPNSNPRDTQS